MSQLSRAQAIAIASIGGGLEMYDFSIYVFFAPVIAKLFFPPESTLVGLINTFAVFAIGYFSRPLGSILFGHYGDKLGRKKGLIITMALMAIATALIGCLPTYQHVGIIATFALILLRFLQGIAVGGDLPGAITFVAEYADDKKRGFVCSLVLCGVNVGLILGSGVGALLTLLPHSALISWGWRVGFISGLLVGAIGLYLRRKIADTPYFVMLEQTRDFAKLPLLKLFRKNWRQVIQGIGLSWLFAVAVAQILLYTPTYLNTIAHMKLATALALNTFNICILCICIPVIGFVSDKIGRKPVLIITSLLIALISFPLYTLLNSDQLLIVIIALIIFAILSASIIAMMPSVLAELFPTNVRYTGVGIAYNVSFAIFAGLTPTIATYLLYQLHYQQAPSYNLILGAVIAFIVALTLNDMSNKSLPK